MRLKEGGYGKNRIAWPHQRRHIVCERVGKLSMWFNKLKESNQAALQTKVVSEKLRSAKREIELARDVILA